MNRSLNHELPPHPKVQIAEPLEVLYWAILPARLAEMERLYRLCLNADDALALRKRAMLEMEAAAARAARSQGTAVAVIPIFGMISRRADLFTDLFGGTPIDRLTQSFRAAMADPSIKAIVLNVDSPGGYIEGVPELASEILAARDKKQIVAVVDGGMDASAAYWLTSAAAKIYASPSSQIGSIGVFAVHIDISKGLEMAGVKPTLITSGKHKGEGHPYWPLSAGAAAFMQKRVDEFAAIFNRAVAVQRGVSVKTVRENFGDGRVFAAAEAKERGLVDGIATLDDVLAKLGVGKGQPAASSPAASAAALPPCAVCCGSGCVVAPGEDGQPKITSELCPGCNGSGTTPCDPHMHRNAPTPEEPAPAADAPDSAALNLAVLRARLLDIEIQRERVL